MSKATGFLKRSQQFQNGEKNGKYSSILSKLSAIASKNKNNLPAFFDLEAIPDICNQDLQTVLAELYPERSYSCTSGYGHISCVRN